MASVVEIYSAGVDITTECDTAGGPTAGNVGHRCLDPIRVRPTTDDLTLLVALNSPHEACAGLLMLL